MNFCFEVISCENGYLILSGSHHSNHYPERKKWVAKNEQELGELLEKLAKEERNRKSETK